MLNDVSKARRWQNKPILGIGLMLLGLLLYPISDALIKHLVSTYTIPQTAFLRGTTRLIPLVIAVFFQGGFKRILSTDHAGRHLVRLGVNLAYTYAFIFSFSLGSLTMVYTLSYTSSFFMIVLSSLFLKEVVSKKKWIAVIAGMLGVLIAIRPGISLFGAASLIVLVGTFLGALNKILMRRLAETEHSLAIAIYPNLMMILVTFPFLFGTWQPMPWSDWCLFAIVGIVTAGAQYAVAQALRFTQASTLAPVDYSSFIWVCALDLLCWDKSPTPYILIGALIIISSNLYILYCTRQEEIVSE